MLREPIEATVREKWDRIVEVDPVRLIECLVFLENAGWEEAGERLGRVAGTIDQVLLHKISAKDDQRRYARALQENAPEGGLPILAESLLENGTKIRGEIRDLLSERRDLLMAVEKEVLTAS